VNQVNLGGWGGWLVGGGVGGVGAEKGGVGATDGVGGGQKGESLHGPSLSETVGLFEKRGN